MALRSKPLRRFLHLPLLWAAVLPALLPQDAAAQLTPQMVEAKKRQEAEKQLAERDAEVKRLQAELERLKQQKQPATAAAPAAANPASAKSGQQPPLDPRVRFRTMEAIMQQPDCELCGQMAVLPAGSFVIGSPKSEKGRDSKEDSPQQPINIRAFEMGRSEVTQAQWRAVMGSSPSRYANCDACPVEQVSWDDITGPDGFLVRLNRLTGSNYRLPSEAEWEYATRAGTDSAFWWGHDFDPRRGNEGTKTLPPVPGYINAFGLAHTAGNVDEWTADCYAETYAQLPTDGSAFVEPQTCSRRVLRGGQIGNLQISLRSARRGWQGRSTRTVGWEFHTALGFRLARSL